MHVSLYFRQVRSEGGEGLMLRRPDVPYSTTRTNDVLKVKGVSDYRRAALGGAQTRCLIASLARKNGGAYFVT